MVCLGFCISLKFQLDYMAFYNVCACTHTCVSDVLFPRVWLCGDWNGWWVSFSVVLLLTFWDRISHQIWSSSTQPTPRVHLFLCVPQTLNDGVIGKLHHSHLLCGLMKIQTQFLYLCHKHFTHWAIHLPWSCDLLARVTPFWFSLSIETSFRISVQTVASYNFCFIHESGFCL